MAVSIETLPSKFLPHLLGHDSCPLENNNLLRAFFDRRIGDARPQRRQPRENVYFLKRGNTKYLLKQEMADSDPQNNQHIYELRTLQKMRRYIQENGLDELFVVPEKFLYYRAETKKFYTIVKAPRTSRPPPGGATQAQITALAKMALKGLSHIHPEHLVFQEGRILLLHADPIYREESKQISPWPFKTFRRSFNLQAALCETHKIKAAFPQFANEIKKIERKAILWVVAELIAQLAANILIVYGIGRLLSPTHSFKEQLGIKYLVSPIKSIKEFFIAHPVNGLKTYADLIQLFLLSTALFKNPFSLIKDHSWKSIAWTVAGISGSVLISHLLAPYAGAALSGSLILRSLEFLFDGTLMKVALTAGEFFKIGLVAQTGVF